MASLSAANQAVHHTGRRGVGWGGAYLTLLDLQLLYEECHLAQAGNMWRRDPYTRDPYKPTYVHLYFMDPVVPG